MQHAVWPLLLLFLLFLVLPASPTPAPTGSGTNLTHISRSKGRFLARISPAGAATPAAKSFRDGLWNGVGERVGAEAVGWITKKLKRNSTVHPTEDDVEARLHASNFAYVMDLAIGKPALNITAVVATNTELIWTQCNCQKCLPQTTPYYYSTKSSTYVPLPTNDPLCPANQTDSSCTYFYNYSSSDSTSGVLARENFSFGFAGHASTFTLVFGCGSTNLGDYSNSTGVVGLGRESAYSLVSQLNTDKFAYCLTSLFNESLSSPLLFGSKADLSGIAGVQSTPILPLNDTPYYFLSLNSISVGAILLQNISSSTFELKPDLSGGFIIDSTIILTYLEQKAYDALQKKIMSVVSLELNNTIDDLLCYNLPSGGSPPDMPNVTFHFHGADMVFPRDKYMYRDQIDGLFCLMIISNGEGGRSILGTYQQQNMRILFDLANSKLSFVPYQCDQLGTSKSAHRENPYLLLCLFLCILYMLM